MAENHGSNCLFAAPNICNGDRVSTAGSSRALFVGDWLGFIHLEMELDPPARFDRIWSVYTLFLRK